MQFVVCSPEGAKAQLQRHVHRYHGGGHARPFRGLLEKQDYCYHLFFDTGHVNRLRLLLPPGRGGEGVQPNCWATHSLWHLTELPVISRITAGCRSPVC
jgi:hypothetical protein